jgi:hypothetical protein
MLWKVGGRWEQRGAELVFTSAGATLTSINTRDFHLSNSDNKGTLMNPAPKIVLFPMDFSRSDYCTVLFHAYYQQIKRAEI